MPTSRPAPAGCFKGVVLRELAPWLHRRFGTAVVCRAFESLPAELKANLDLSSSTFGALPSTWYDAGIYRHVLDVLMESQPATEHVTLALEAAKTVVEHTIRGIYAKLFRMMATPPLYARYVQKLWDMHYDSGTVSVEHLSSNKALHRVQGWLGHHPFACLINRQSGVIVYSSMGMANVYIEQERCAWPICEATYAWD